LKARKGRNVRNDTFEGAGSQAPRAWREVLRNAPVSTAVATWFGVGFLPGPTGTWGSLAAIPIVELLQRAWGVGAGAIFALAVTVAGVVASHRCVRLRGAGDPHEIVVDEVAGQAIALVSIHFFFPAAAGLSLVFLVLGSFLLFRLLDVLKPGPVGRAEDLPGGLGVMADDVVAGLIVALLPALAALAGLGR
jgi:phosphatidylglycerophosphatase A